jgi:hypothetical protein
VMNVMALLVVDQNLPVYVVGDQVRRSGRWHGSPAFGLMHAGYSFSGLVGPGDRLPQKCSIYIYGCNWFHLTV